MIHAIDRTTPRGTTTATGGAMTSTCHARKRRLANAVLRRSAGAATAVVLALGGIVVTETASATDDPVLDPEQTTTSTEVDEPKVVWSLSFEEGDVAESCGAEETGDDDGDPGDGEPDEGEEGDGSTEPASTADLRYHCWKVNGDPRLAIVDDPTAPDSPDAPKNQVLQITRTNDWDGIASPAKLQSGTDYNFSMRVRIADGGEVSSSEARFLGNGNYWIGNNAISSNDWEVISGPWVDVADSSTVNLGFGIYKDPNNKQFTVLVDDILVTERGEPRLTVTDEQGFVPGDEVTVAGFDFPTGQWESKNVTLTFEQDNNTIGQSAQVVATDRLGWFGDTTVTLPANVDPTKPLYLVATSEDAVVEHEITFANRVLLPSHGTVARGGTLELNGSGFAANTYVQITADLAATITVLAGPEGTFVVPAWTAPVLPTENLEIVATSYGYPAITATAKVDVTATGDPDAPAEPEIAVIDEGDIVPADVVTIFGFGFSSNESGTVTMAGNGYFPPTPFETDDNGQFRLTDVTIPNYWEPGGVFTVHAEQPRSGDRADTTITIAGPTISVGKAALGGTVTIYGTGFIAHETLQYQVKIGSQTQTSSIQADAEGRFMTTAPVPFDAETVLVSANQWGRNSPEVEAERVESTDPLLIPATKDVHREGTVDVTGYNFPAGHVISLTIGDGTTPIQLTAEANGSFTEPITIPKGTHLGELKITANALGGVPATATATVNVIPAKPDDHSTITATPGQGVIVSGVPFTLGGSHFDPNLPVMLRYFLGDFSDSEAIAVDAIGGATVNPDTIGRFEEHITMPHLSTSGYVTIVATQGDHRATTTVQVTTTDAPGSITIDGTGPYKPGDTLPITWNNLVPGHIMVTMTSGMAALPDGHIVVSSTGSGSAGLTIGVDTLVDEEEYPVFVTATQGGVVQNRTIKVRNDFGPYKKAFDDASALISRRNAGEFRDVDAPWGTLAALLAHNEFKDTVPEEATQGMANRAEAALLAALQGVAEKLLEAAVRSADNALASYAHALDTNAALAEAVGGSAHALVESLVATSEERLKATTDDNPPGKLTSLIADYDFTDITTDEQPGIPVGVWSSVLVDEDSDSLVVTRVNDWDGLDLPANQFYAGDVCTFNANVEHPHDQPGDRNGEEDINIRFLAHYSETRPDGSIGREWDWIGSTKVVAGTSEAISGTWTVPEGGVAYIRLVAGAASEDDERFPNHAEHDEPPTDSPAWYTFYAHSVHVECERAPEKVQPEPVTFLDLESQLQDAIRRLTYALAHFEAGQVLWAPAPGNEPGWVEGDGLFTDDSLARWIGHNLYILGNSSELEGRTFVAHDLSLDKTRRYDGGWTGFNFGTVSIGSQIALSGKLPALLVCDDMVVNEGFTAHVNGGAYAVQDANRGDIRGTNLGMDDAVAYCAEYSQMASSISDLSDSLANRPTDGGDCDCDEGPSQHNASEANVADGKLTLTAGTPNADGLYVFEIAGTELTAARSIVIEGLQEGQSSQATGGRISSMKPAVINVTGHDRVDWEIESIYLRSDGYNQLYAGDKFWHPDLGKVAGALMWNFPDVTDDRAAQDPGTTSGAGVDLLPGLPGEWTGFLHGSVKPGVTIRTTGLGVNFLGSILIPNASLLTDSVSLNGRLYVGGDYVMHDTLTKREGDPLYGGGYYSGSGSSPDLLGHAEGHNYPWWFDPFTAAPSDSMMIKKAVAPDVIEGLEGEVNGKTLFAKGRLRCMHVEDAAERHLTPESDAWWADGLKDDPYLLSVDVAWWVTVNDEGIKIDNMPQGTLCGLSEDLGLYTVDDASITESDMIGKLPRGSSGAGSAAPGCNCGYDLKTPAFTPVSVPKGWAWALPDVRFDEAAHPVTVSAQGPTASLLLTTETQKPTAEITNSLTPLGQAAITKLAVDKDDNNVPSNPGADAPEFEFTWSASLDGYVYVPGEGDGDGESGTYYLVRLEPSARTVTVAAGDTAKPQYCPSTKPGWWPHDSDCLDLSFSAGTKLTWTEVEGQHTIDGIVYDVENVAYQGGQTVTILAGEDTGGTSTVTTTVTNTLVQAPLRFAVQKRIVGTGWDLVLPDTEFTIVYEAWADADGNGTPDDGGLLNDCSDGRTDCENTLVVCPDGNPVYSTAYDANTLIRVVSEDELPVIPGVTWGTPKFSTEPEPSSEYFQLTKGAPTPVVTVTNTAHGPASFELSKAIPSEFVGTAWTLNFNLEYTLSRPVGGEVKKIASEMKTHSLQNGHDKQGGAVTKVGGNTLHIGDIITITEPENGFDEKYDWDETGYTVIIRNTRATHEGNLTSCQDRGFVEKTGCPDRSFRITEDNINSIVVTVVNRLVGPPGMPMTGGALAAWLAIVAGLGLGGYLSLRRAYTARHATAQGGAMR